MPKVGKKKFPYTKKGVAEAKKEAATTGMPMSTGHMMPMPKVAPLRKKPKR